MNHALKITEDGTMIVTVPEDKTVDRVVVKCPGYRKVFVHNVMIVEKIRRTIIEYFLKSEEGKTNENRNKP